MVKNVILKKALKGSVFKIASFINKMIPKNEKIVLLYSANKGIQHSLLPLRKYLLANDFDKKYRIICGIESMKYAEDNERVRFVPRLLAYKIFFRAKYVFYTTGQIPIKPSKTQCVIHLRHGNTNFKTSGKLTKIGNGDEYYFTYMAATAPYFKRIISMEYGCAEDSIIVMGDPLIDQLFDEPPAAYSFPDFKKVILWLPTFRQSDYLGYDDSKIEDLVPMFNENDYPQLNELLKENNIKLIVKVHPAQKNFDGGERHFSHFDVYTNDEFASAGLALYPLMARADALIGDYSSASMQYLVLDRPQAYVVPDIEDYGNKRGFVFENPEDYMAGHIIKTKEQFIQFINDIAAGRDVYSEKRRKVRQEMYTFPDNRNCERIIQFSGMKRDI